MIKKTQLGQVPPTVMGSLSDRNSGWYPIYAAVRTQVGKRHYGAYAKCLIRYADDFCGGVQVRSCTAGSCTPRVSSWGWEGQWFGKYLSDSDASRGKDPVEQLASTANISFVDPALVTDEHGHVDTGTMKDLCLAAIASRVMLFANDSKRNGIFGTDRADREDDPNHGIASLMDYMTRMSGWSDWQVPYFNGNGSNGYLRHMRFPEPYQRSVGTTEFYNFNSERDVAVFTSFHADIDEDEGYDEDWWERHVCNTGNLNYTITEQEKAACLTLTDLCPTTEWCVG